MFGDLLGQERCISTLDLIYKLLVLHVQQGQLRDSLGC